MKIKIAGKATSENQVSVHPAWPCPEDSSSTQPYALSISCAEVLDSFSSYFNDYCADARAHPSDGAVALVRQLSNLGWPSLVDLMTSEPQLFERFVLEVGYDFLHAIFAGSRADAHRYWICHLDEVSLGQVEATLRGTALEWRGIPGQSVS